MMIPINLAVDKLDAFEDLSLVVTDAPLPEPFPKPFPELFPDPGIFHTLMVASLEAEYKKLSLIASA